MKKKQTTSIAQATKSWSSANKLEPRSTLSGIEIPALSLPPVYASESEYLAQIGLPGEFPYTRGVQASMYRGRLWTMRQYSGFGTARETNERYRYLLARGTTGLSVAFDLPTQMGRDSDHALAQGEVGRVGVAIDSIEDMETLFSGIPLDEVSTSVTINATAHILLGLYLVAASRRNISWEKLRGTVQNDILKEYLARGTFIYPPKGGLKIVTDIIEFCRDRVPQWNSISISGYHIREAGSTAAEELALTIADGISYVEAAIARGMEVDSFAPRLAFFFNCHNNFLEEIAKFRAARRMWAKLMRERFRANSPKSCMLRFHTQTAGSSLTAQQPQVNVVRTALQAMAAVLGGTQSLHTNGYDEAVCLPTEESALLALRTQQVLASESGVADFIDPLAGSYAVEHLTDRLEEKAFELIAKIDGVGGMVRALELGIPQRWIEDSAFEYQKGMEEGRIEVVGVNVQTEGEGSHPQIPMQKIDPRLEAEQIARVQAYRSRRNVSNYQVSMKELERVAREDRNIMPAVIGAIESDATLGEISDVLRSVYGEHH